MLPDQIGIFASGLTGCLELWFCLNMDLIHGNFQVQQFVDLKGHYDDCICYL